MTNDIEKISAIAALANQTSVSGELSFSHENVLAAIGLSTLNDIAVLGVEIFQVYPDGFYTVKMSSYELHDPEGSWPDFVRANNAFAEQYCNGNLLEDNQVYVLTTSSLREFREALEVKEQP